MMNIFLTIQLFIIFLFTVYLVNALFRQDWYWIGIALIGIVSTIIASAIYCYEIRGKSQ